VQVGAGVHPRKAGLIVELGAGPVLHGDDGEWGVDMFRAVVELREFAEGHAVAHGNLCVVGVVAGAGIGDRAFDGKAADRIRTIEHDDVDGVVELALLTCRGFEKVAGEGLVGVGADAGVLQVDDDGVEVGKLLM